MTRDRIECLNGIHSLVNQWMNSSLIHDSICKFIHKVCHPKKTTIVALKTICTLSIIFSVLGSLFPRQDEWPCSWMRMFLSQDWVMVIGPVGMIGL